MWPPSLIDEIKKQGNHIGLPLQFLKSRVLLGPFENPRFATESEREKF